MNINSFEMIAEILSGCDYNCNDCYIDTNVDNKITEQLYNILDDFLLNGHEPYLFFIGSTDVFTARNRHRVFNDIRLINYINKYKRVIINSTLLKLDDQILDIIKCLDNSELQINIVIPETKITNEKYFNNISNNIKYIKNIITDKKIIIHPQINFSFEMDFNNYDDLVKLYERYFDIGVDFNPSFFRKLDAELIIKSLKKMKKAFLSSDVKYDGSLYEKHIDCATLHDRTERTLFYSNGDVYIAPIFYEEAFVTIEKYKISSYNEYKEKFTNLISEQYKYIEDENIECANCPVSTSCVLRNTISIMKDFDIKECLLPKEIIIKHNGL